MSFTKTILAVAAVGALTAATAVPAMALENEFHGMYKMKYFVSNLDNGSNGYFYEGPSAAQLARGTSQSASNYFEQRARLFYSAKANDDLKLVLGFEIDSAFGDRAQGSVVGLPASGNTTTAFRNSGGALDTDAVNLETKWVHLDFNIPGAPVNVKVGTQPIKDSLKGVLFDVDAGGIYTSTKIGSAAKVNLGYFRGYEGNGGDTTGGSGVSGGLGFKMGVNNLDLVILEGKYNITKDIAVGANYYGYFDYRSSAATILDHTFGLNADANVGPVNLSGFLAGQIGIIRNQTGLTTGTVNNSTADVDLNGIAANVTAKVKVGPGTAKLAGLYTSGDSGNRAGHNHSWLSLQQSASGAVGQSAASSLNSYNDSGMMLMNRNASAQGTTTDRSIGWTSNNRDQGLILATTGYDAVLTPKLYANANVGFGWTSASRTANVNDVGDGDALKPVITGGGVAGRRNASNFLGTEFNVETGYKLYDNLTASVQAAYLVLGGYYKATNQIAGKGGTDPENPYTTRVVLSYTF
jgi:hypothetical protein